VSTLGGRYVIPAFAGMTGRLEEEMRVSSPVGETAVGHTCQKDAVAEITPYLKPLHAERSEASHTQRFSNAQRVRFLAALGMT
jgi:hypothetical protein